MDVSSGSAESMAQKTFEIDNDVQTIDANDALFRYDEAQQKAIDADAPWSRDPHYFTEVKISAVALIKMVMHARSGGQYEIMGVMNGKIVDRAFVVLDAFALPVQGTETRVNAGNEAMEYMVSFSQGNEEAGKKELLVGWYHSHPGYGCWLSGIDVNTQNTNQKFNDPYLAVVIDPNRTISAGKVEIGAFRTYPEGYTPPDATSSGFQSIPLDKIEDFGVHANSYYPLKVSVFKSSSDAKLLGLLWNKYWVNTLSQSPLVSSRAYATSQIKDLTAKLAQSHDKMALSLQRGGPGGPGGGGGSDQATLTRKKVQQQQAGGKQDDGEGSQGKGEQVASVGVWEENPSSLRKAAMESDHISSEARHGLISQAIKDRLFNSDLKSAPIVTPPSVLTEAP